MMMRITNMSKVYFNYGTMNSSKSLQLLAVAHNYESQGKRVMCFKPKLDDRDEDIKTRAGLNRRADVVLDKDDNSIMQHVFDFGYLNLDCILVDEAQFMTREQILAFTDVADIIGVPVIAYGLLTDFQGNLFEGSKALIEFADKKEEVKTICEYCNSKAMMNARFFGDKPIFNGEQIKTGDVGADEESYSYKPVCRKCYKTLQKWDFDWIVKPKGSDYIE
jgi:thymidine kinase